MSTYAKYLYSATTNFIWERPVLSLAIAATITAGTAACYYLYSDSSTESADKGPHEDVEAQCGLQCDLHNVLVTDDQCIPSGLSLPGRQVMSAPPSGLRRALQPPTFIMPIAPVMRPRPKSEPLVRHVPVRDPVVEESEGSPVFGASSGPLVPYVPAPAPSAQRLVFTAAGELLLRELSALNSLKFLMAPDPTLRPAPYITVVTDRMVRLLLSILQDLVDDVDVDDGSGEGHSRESAPRHGSMVWIPTRNPQLSPKDFVVRKVLGQGGFSKVLLAECRELGWYFAVKAQKKSCDESSTSMEERVLELGRDCPFLAQLYSTFQTQNHLFFTMDYLSGGRLSSHLEYRGGFDADMSVFYAAEVVVGLQFLHSRGIVHRDVKPDNVMLDGAGHIKIIGFGVSQDIVSHNQAMSRAGTWAYMAPECLSRSIQRYSFSEDWWSFGVMLFEMLTGKLPRMGTPRYRFWIEKDARDLLEKLFEFDPRSRLGTVGDVRDHPFFRHLNWDAVEQRQLLPPIIPDVKALNDCRLPKDLTNQELKLVLPGFHQEEPRENWMSKMQRKHGWPWIMACVTAVGGLAWCIYEISRIVEYFGIRD